MNSFYELVKSNRSCRRFDQSRPVSRATLESLVDLARMTASAGNLQPLKYILSADEQMNEEIFSCLAWAAYLSDWKGPSEGEKPSGYIVVLGDTSITSNFRCDHGIAAQTVMLGAREQGLAGCMFGAINHKKLRRAAGIEDHFEILLVLAIGKPVETVRIEPVADDGSIKYYRDEHGVHHVPKRRLEELIVKSYPAGPL
ncbi:MAG: nitroreductase family protein [Thermodesulfobacteriota bacterium]